MKREGTVIDVYDENITINSYRIEKVSFKNDVNKTCNKNVQYFRCRLFTLFSLNINKKLSLQCFLKQSLNLLHNSICVLFEDFPLTASRVFPYKLVVITEKSAPCICIVYV